MLGLGRANEDAPEGVEWCESNELDLVDPAAELDKEVEIEREWEWEWEGK